MADTPTGQLPHEEQAEAEGQDALTGSLLALQLESKGSFLFCGPQDPSAQTNQGQGQGPVPFLFLEILFSSEQNSPLSAMDWAG